MDEIQLKLEYKYRASKNHEDRLNVLSEIMELFNPYHDKGGLFTSKGSNTTGGAGGGGQDEAKKMKKAKRRMITAGVAGGIAGGVAGAVVGSAAGRLAGMSLYSATRVFGKGSFDKVDMETWGAFGSMVGAAVGSRVGTVKGVKKGVKWQAKREIKKGTFDSSMGEKKKQEILKGLGDTTQAVELAELHPQLAAFVSELKKFLATDKQAFVLDAGVIPDKVAAQIGFKKDGDKVFATRKVVENIVSKVG